MTARTAVRRLPYRHFDRLPTASLDVTAWCVESLLSLAADYDDPQILEVLTRLNPDAPQTIAAELDALYALSSQVAEAGRYAASDDGWEAPRAMVEDEYAAQLTRVARLVRAR
jgi:hypothetical protein